MTPDRTNHVIAAIDGALDDDSLGPDAMRWNPDPQPQPPARGTHLATTTVVSGALHVPPGPRLSARPPRSNHTGPIYVVDEAYRWDEDTWRTYVAYFHASVVIPMARVRAAFDEMRRAAVQLSPLLDEAWTVLRPVVPPAADEENPQTRALRLRRERNTGPARPTGERARRPRRHT